MSTAFKVFIRIIFIGAYAAFLYASLHHIAYFFHSFEPSSTDWTGSYLLAGAFDITALVLTISVMFFRQNLALSAKVSIWLLIVGITGLSWLINWEYARQFQSQDFSNVPEMYWINPVIASAFAFLNLAYSVVAEFFNSKQESAAELQQKLEELKQTSQVKQELSALKNQQLSSLISGKVQVLRDAFLAQNQPESLPDSQQEMPQISEGNVPVSHENEDEIGDEIGTEEEQESPLHLGMIEQAMYDAFMKHPEEAEELLRLSQEQNLDEFVATLQAKYSQYASYITPTRVANVMQFIRQHSVKVPLKGKPRMVSVPQATKPSQYFMTFEEAVRYTGYAEVTLRKQLKSGEIEANKNGDKLKVSTLRIRTGHTAQMPALKAVKFDQEPHVMNGTH